jgi:hypothetical protein
VINCIFWFDRFSFEYYILVIWCSPLCYKLSFTETNFKLLVYHPLHMIIFHLWHSKILRFLLISMLHFYTCFNWFFQITIKLFLTIGCKKKYFCRISVWQLFHYLWPHQPFSFTYFCRFSNYNLVTFPFVLTLTFHFIPKYHLFFHSIAQIGCLLFTVPRC